MKKSNRRQKKPYNSTGVRPNKSLGQNFLVDEEIISQIADSSGATKESLVIEIGPGTGALTCSLAEKSGRLICVELDERMIEPLRVKTYAYGNVEIIHDDILQIDLNEIIESRCKKYSLSDVRIVGNLPYYITTPIIMKLLEMNTKAASITVMMQKEVGERIAALPGSRKSGAITYSVYYYADVSRIVEVGRECFYPQPKVDSVVLRLDLINEPRVDVKDEDLLFRCIKAGFAQRRKTIINSLSSTGDYNKEIIKLALEKAGIDPVQRAEKIDLKGFADIANALSEAHFAR